MEEGIEYTDKKAIDIRLRSFTIWVAYIEYYQVKHIFPTIN